MKWTILILTAAVTANIALQIYGRWYNKNRRP